MTEPEVYDYYFLFSNHQEGLRAYKHFKDSGIKCTIAPTPREASTSCGISLLVTEDQVETARKIALAPELKIDAIAPIRRKNKSRYKSC
ncbi:MAG: DUF3343 domain-containing protein [Syntrophomonadaceae bacterium]|nr:DUF3343 domain-containing protein [Syntrophomonadaceae bacterium]